MNDVPALGRLEGPSPAAEVARDMVKRGLPLVPVGLIIGALIDGFDGAASVGYGMAIVLVNLLLSAALLAWASKISFAAVSAAALGGYALRLGLVFAAVMLVKDQSWIALRIRSSCSVSPPGLGLRTSIGASLPSVSVSSASTY